MLGIRRKFAAVRAELVEIRQTISLTETDKTTARLSEAIYRICSVLIRVIDALP